MIKAPYILLPTLLLTVFGCKTESNQPRETIQVCAASSLRHNLNEKLHPVSPVTTEPVMTRYDASSRIARQVEQGAPCHVFVSASTAWVDRLEKKGQIQKRWAPPDWRNSLAVLRSKRFAGRLQSLEDLNGVSRLAIGAPNVPLGSYSREVLHRFPVSNTRVIVGRNAEQVLRLVEQGEADAAIVYASDIPFARDVEVAFHIPETLHSPVQYELALLRNAPPDASRLFESLQNLGIGLLSTEFLNNRQGEWTP